MPLRAIIDNKEVISSFLSTEEWNDLKDYVKSNSLNVTIAQTSKKGYLRTSKKGLQHFVHKKGEKPDDWKPESPQHLLAKSEVILGCKDAGWEALSEFIENDWIADVIAIKESKRIAFEIQWSNQTYERTIERQERYKRDNVRGCWLFRKPAKQFFEWGETLKADNEIPLFKIYETENNEIWVDFYGQKIPIRKFIKSLLNREIKFCNYMTANNSQEITISFFETFCWQCKSKQHVYFIQEFLESRCGQRIYIEKEMWGNENLKFAPQILKSIFEFLTTKEGEQIKLGKIKKRYSKTTNSSYMSFGCFKCDSIFGDWFLNTEIMEAKMSEMTIDISTNINISDIKEEHKHWCLSKEKNHCE